MWSDSYYHFNRHSDVNVFDWAFREAFESALYSLYDEYVFKKNKFEHIESRFGYYGDSNEFWISGKPLTLSLVELVFPMDKCSYEYIKKIVYDRVRPEKANSKRIIIFCDNLRIDIGSHLAFVEIGVGYIYEP